MMLLCPLSAGDACDDDGDDDMMMMNRLKANPGLFCGYPQTNATTR